MKILVLNGPPNVGKDTLADNLIDWDVEDWFKLSFKAQLYEETAEYYKIDLQKFIFWASDRYIKETPIPELKGFTPRQAMIHVSENIMKPRYGKDHYGKALLNIIQNLNHIENIVIPDGGFEEEVTVLMDAYPDEVWIVHMTSQDCSFKNDSRDYIKGWPDQTYELEINRGHTSEDYEKLANILDEIQDISVARSRLNDEPDDTPYMTEDFEGDRHYIGEENE